VSFEHTQAQLRACSEISPRAAQPGFRGLKSP
jgi:hypothetical protein